MSVCFTVTGIPIPWPRAHATAQILRIAGKLKAVAKIYVPEDDDIKKFKHDIAFEAGKAFAETPGYPMLMECPVSVAVTFVFPRPGYMIWKKKPMVRVPMADVPDSDNLAKAVLDGLNRIVYVDDRQVCELVVRKYYADGTEPPHTMVVLSELT